MLKSRKIIRQKISFDFLEQILKGNSGIISETTCPKDLKVVGVEGAFEGNFNRSFDIICQSDLFEEVPLGSMIPLGKPFVYIVDKEWEIYKKKKKEKGDNNKSDKVIECIEGGKKVYKKYKPEKLAYWDKVKKGDVEING